MGYNNPDLNELVFSVRDSLPHISYGRDSLDYPAFPIGAGEWYHLAWVYKRWSENPDTNIVTATHTIHVNGSSSWGWSVYRSMLQDHLITSPLVVGYHVETLGAEPDPEQRDFSGLMDDLTIVRAALSQAEIQAMMNDAPLLNLHLDEDYVPESSTSSATFIDDSPYNNDAACSGYSCPKGGDKGQMRESPVFTGSHTLVITASDDLDLSDEFSLGLWVKPRQSKGEKQILISKSDAANNYADANFYLSLLPNTLRLQFGLDGGANCSTELGPINSTNELIQDQWNHVIATFDGISLMLYVNGSFDNAALLSSSTQACVTADKAVIGAGFEGSMDEVAVYGVALDAEKVDEIYNYQAAWFDVFWPYHIVVDSVAPVVTLGADGSYLQADPNIVLSIDAFDEHSKVELVEYAIEGGDGWHTAEADGDAWIFDFYPLGGGTTDDLLASHRFGRQRGLGAGHRHRR